MTSRVSIVEAHIAEIDRRRPLFTERESKLWLGYEKLFISLRDGRFVGI